MMLLFWGPCAMLPSVQALVLGILARLWDQLQSDSATSPETSGHYGSLEFVKQIFHRGQRGT